MFETLLQLILFELRAAPWWLLLLCYISVGFVQYSLIYLFDRSVKEEPVLVFFGGILWPVGTLAMIVAVTIAFPIWALGTLHRLIFGDKE